MSRTLNNILNTLDWFLSSKDLGSNLIELNQKRAAVFYLLSQLPLCFIFGFIFAFYIPLGSMYIIAPLGGVLFFCSLLISKYGGQSVFVTHVGPGMTLFSISYAVYYTGGI